MLTSRPIKASVLGLIGGSILVLVGWSYIYLESVLTLAVFKSPATYGPCSVAFGVLMVMASATMCVRPGFSRIWEMIVLGLSALSIPVGGGHGRGFVFGLSGGGSAVFWKPASTISVPS